ncbi:MAG: TolC family protein, partial [Pseudomonadales bacterium]
AEYNSHNWRATLRQPVFRLDLWYRFQTAKRQRAEAAANFAAEQQELLVRVADSYFTILEQESRLDASNAERSAVQRQLEQVQQRFDVGLVAITDVLESQAAFDSATVNVIEAEGGQSTSFETLLRLTGRPHNAISGLAEDFPVKYPDPADEDAWVKAALSNNYSLKAAGERLQVARRSLHAARSRYLPQINADVSYSHNVSGGHRRDCTTALNDPALNASGSFVIPQLNRDGTPRLDSNGAPLVDVVDLNDCSPTNPGLPGNSITPTTEADLTVAQLSISMPIFQGGALRAGSKQAKYNLDAAQKNFDLQQRRTVETTKNLYLAVTTDVARVKARKRGIESSQSALDATQTGYEVGTRNIVDVLLAQQRLYLSQFQYASARYKYVRDTLRLKQAAGILNPDDLYDLNNYINDELIVTRTRASTR